MDQSIVELNQKIDLLTSQVTYLTEQAGIVERQRQERAELIKDLIPLADQAFELTVEQLEEIKENINLYDLLRIIKRLLRNGHNLEKMLNQLESFSDLVETMSPLADEMFCKVVRTMSDLDQKGYFTIARDIRSKGDEIIDSMSEQEMQSMDISYTGLLKKLREPDTRRGLAMTLRILQVIGGRSPVNKQVTKAENHGCD